MVIKIIQKLTEESLLSEANNAEQTTEFMKALRENLEKVSSQADQSLLLFVIFITGWVLAYSSLITKISILGIELNNLNIMVVILLPISAFLFYRFLTLLAFAAVIEESLRIIYGSHFKNFNDSHLTELLCYPTFPAIEYAIDVLNSEKSIFKKITSVWIMIIFLLFTLIPIIGFIWISYLIIFKTTISLPLSILSVAITMILTSRALLVFVQSMNLIT